MKKTLGSLLIVPVAIAMAMFTQTPKASADFCYSGWQLMDSYTHSHDKGDGVVIEVTHNTYWCAATGQWLNCTSVEGGPESCS
jgi:hypothetical protein